MASSPITSWQIAGETMETMTDFIFLGSKITADGDCSHGRHLLLGRKAMTNIERLKIMSSGPMTSWQVERERVEAVIDIFLGSRISADGECSHEIRRRLLLGRKAMKN